MTQPGPGAGQNVNLFQQSQLLNTLPLAVLGPLARTAQRVRFGAGDVIFDKDAVDDRLFIVMSGVIEIRTRAEGQRIATLRAGQPFGELAAFDPSPRSTAAVAKTDCEVVAVTRSSLVEVLESSPGALLATVGNLARSLSEAGEQVALVNRFLDNEVRGRTEQVRETQLELVHRLSSVAEFRDGETGANIYRMTRYCKVIADGAGLDDQAVNELLLAAPMHDIGKIGVPDSVLRKAGALDEDEWRIMQAHTTMGAQILGGSRSSAIQLAEQIALEHHERWDGTGYPSGMRGEEISLEARISTIADVFDALTAERPYKEAWPFEKAVDLVDSSRGTMFDPELVEIFLHEGEQVHAIHVASLEGTLQPPSWRLQPLDPTPDASADED